MFHNAVPRRQFLAAVGLAASSLASAKQRESGKRPNIIYFICHDLGKELECYGKPIATPNLNAFAENGVKFENYFCSSTCCTPSRCCAYTGQYAHTNGVMGLANYGWSMSEDVRSIVDYFNDGGYETAHIGLQHERHADLTGAAQVAPSAKANRYQVELCESWRDMQVEVAVDKAIGYLKTKQGTEKPFYLNIGTSEVHASQWMSRGTMGFRRDVYGSTPPEETYMPPQMPDVPTLRKEMGNFQACIRYTDKHVKRLFEAVRDLGLAENTLVIFTTDHGMSGTRAKGSLYDAGVEITMLMQMPGTLGQGVVVDELLQNIDIAPTLLEVANIPIPDAIQGRSFWPLLTGRDYQPHDVIFMERNYHGAAEFFPIRAARTPQFHYIKNFKKGGRSWMPGDPVRMKDTYDTWFTEMGPWGNGPRDEEELYDIVADPLERDNLANDPAFSDVKKALSRQMQEWMVDTDDPILKGEFGIPGRHVESEA